MKMFRILLLLMPLLLGMVTCAFGKPESGEKFTISAVQFSVEEDLYRSEKRFYRHVEAIIRREVEQNRPDLIVFPEYTSVFLALMPYYETVAAAESLEEGITRLYKKYPGVTSVRSIFLNDTDVFRRMDRIWGSLADDWDLFIAAGTAFVPEEDGSGKVGLRNRLFLYGPEGGLEYTQDKVYLTEFETEVVGVDSGSPDEARLVDLRGLPFAFTICRDTFFEVWEDRFEDAYVWLDVKANGTKYDEDQARNFETALPERIASSPVPFGITVCLTGSFLDLFWEGESSIVRNTGDDVELIEKSERPDTQDILRISIPFGAN